MDVKEKEQMLVYGVVGTNTSYYSSLGGAKLYILTSGIDGNQISVLDLVSWYTCAESDQILWQGGIS